MEYFKKVLIFVLCLVLFVVPLLSFGQGGGASLPGAGGSSGGPCGGDGYFPNPLNGVCSLADFVQKIITVVVMPIGGAVCTVFIIYAGFLFVTARGNPEKLEGAKAAIFNAIIGTVILLGAWAIASAITATLNSIVK